MSDKKKSVLITGAAGGIGRVMAQVFNHAGYRVIATDVLEKPADLVCTSYIKLDLFQYAEDEEYANRMNINIRSELNGKLDVLINNAAVQILGKTDNLTRQDWQTTVDVNLLAPFFLVQSMISELENAKGNIINIGSIHAHLTKRNFVAYATSKAALAGMTRALAIDLAGRVRVNGIEPAAIETEMLLSGFSKNPNQYEKLNSFHPIGRIGRAEEVASAALWVASNSCSFMHGESIRINGGISSRLHDPDE